jgi:hypothetical protein
MAHGYIRNKFAPKVFYFRRAQIHISELQITANLIGCLKVLKQALADKDQDIPTDIAMPGN